MTHQVCTVITHKAFASNINLQYYYSIKVQIQATDLGPADLLVMTWTLLIVLAVLGMDGWCVPEEMLVPMQLVSEEPRDILCDEPAMTLGPVCGYLNLEDLLKSS